MLVDEDGEDYEDIKQAQLVGQINTLIAEHSLQGVLSGLSIACAQITRSLQVQQVAGESLDCPDDQQLLWAKTADLMALLANTHDWQKLHKEFAREINSIEERD